MKKIGMIFASLLFMGGMYAQDSTGLEGDNLDLNGVLELFKESDNVEDFEKKLNSEDNGVNNLDLNEDGEVDYIRVIDHAEDDAHALALQVPVNENESQDVAVIEMEQVDEKTTNLQVIGDAELYGESYMIEPQDEKNKSVVVNVNTWRPVRHIYGPRYTVWVSPWGWNARPTWYRPWRRLAWNAYYPRVYRYRRPCYRFATVRRCNRARAFYAVHHVHSPTFYGNHHHHHGWKSAQPKSGNTVGIKSTKSTGQPSGKVVQTKSTAKTSSPTHVKRTTTTTTKQASSSPKSSGKQTAKKSTGTIQRNASTRTQSSSTQRKSRSVKSSSTRKSATPRSSGSSSRGKSNSGRSSSKRSGGKSSGGRR